MDKYEYRIRAEEINALIEQKDYIQAVKNSRYDRLEKGQKRCNALQGK